MRIAKTLLMLGAAVAGGLYLASRRASDKRARLRGAYEILKGVVAPHATDRVAGAPHAEPHAEPTARPAERAEFTPSQVSVAAEVARHLEHAIEHGADGRARSAQQSRRPNALVHGVRHS